MNQVALVARICTMEKRDTAKGSVLNLRIAVGGRNGSTNFLAASLWHGVNAGMKHLAVGRLIGITGSLVSRQYQAKDGSARESVAINVERYYFLDRPRVSQEGVS